VALDVGTVLDCPGRAVQVEPYETQVETAWSSALDAIL